MAVVVCSLAQTETATISGLVTDQQGALIVGADVVITNTDTSVGFRQTTNKNGLYVASGLKPGHYRVTVSRGGFRTVNLTDLVLNVQDSFSQNFKLQVGSASESITVVAEGAAVNTESATVSTVIDRTFVDNLPLNGRSFNTLLQLTPGVVIAPTGGRITSPGQFSVAGQRTDANNFTVDGVSANFGVAASPNPGASGTGSAQAFSALGGTSSLVSVEALQEFRVATSSYAPESGRAPGGQVALTTRSGTNALHGGMYEYFRNDLMDANDWFANQAGLPRPKERHNNFGAYAGGPILRNRTFFFASYEGTRLRQPATSVLLVPSVFARTSAPSSLAPYLDAYPLPNDKTIVSGVYTATLNSSFSNAAQLDAGSIRIDHRLGSRVSLFARYNDAPSELLNRNEGTSTLSANPVGASTFTLGLNIAPNSRTLNTLRANYSTQHAANSSSLDSFGGAVPPPDSLLTANLVGQNFVSFGTFDVGSYHKGPSARNTTRQFNLVDDYGALVGSHQLKFGIDYRRINLKTSPAVEQVFYTTPTVQQFLTSNGQVTLQVNTKAPGRIKSQALSMYVQDTWNPFPRLTLNYGVRWELSPAPTGLGGTVLASWLNVDNPEQISLAPHGTPVWHTKYSNFAPRVGIAYALTDDGGFVIRAGGGLFYDLGLGTVSNLVNDWPNTATNSFQNVNLPVSDLDPFIPALSTSTPYGVVEAFDPNLALSRSYQWNVAIEKSFGRRQVISATYLGQAGSRLLRQEALFRPNPNFAREFFLTANSARSNYDALQLQYRKMLSQGLQALVSYSWAHSLDNSSNDVVAGLSRTVISAENDYGASDFDVRHSLSGGLSYAIPSALKSGPLAALVRDWSLQSIFVVRSGFSFNALVIGQSPDIGGFVETRPDLVPGQQLWLHDSAAPGSKSLNPNAFVVPSTTRQGNERRNDINGFGMTQIDLSVERKFRLRESTSLQLRGDAFNVTNHPNFSNPSGLFQFGPSELQSGDMLNQLLGGLNPLFQQGGPRSLQVSLRLEF